MVKSTRIDGAIEEYRSTRAETRGEHGKDFDLGKILRNSLEERREFGDATARFLRERAPKKGPKKER